MFSRLPMLAISRGARKPTPTSMARSCFRLFAHRLALSSEVWTRAHRRQHIPRTQFILAHSASTRPGACSLAYPDIAHQPAILLLRYEHVPSVAGAHVSVLGR